MNRDEFIKELGKRVEEYLGGVSVGYEPSAYRGATPDQIKLILEDFLTYVVESDGLPKSLNN